MLTAVWLELQLALCTYAERLDASRCADSHHAGCRSYEKRPPFCASLLRSSRVSIWRTRDDILPLLDCKNGRPSQSSMGAGFIVDLRHCHCVMCCKMHDSASPLASCTACTSQRSRRTSHRRTCCAPDLRSPNDVQVVTTKHCHIVCTHPSTARARNVQAACRQAYRREQTGEGGG